MHAQILYRNSILRIKRTFRENREHNNRTYLQNVSQRFFPYFIKVAFANTALKHYYIKNLSLDNERTKTMKEHRS